MFNDFARYQGVALIAEDGSTVSYSDLDQRINAYIAHFSAGRGLALLECDNTIDTIVAFVAALRARQPLLLVGKDNSEAVSQYQRSYSILYHLKPSAGAVSIDEQFAGLDIHPDLALLLSTSGSTGAAKCVRLSFENLASNARSIAEYLTLTSADRAITTLPLQYSFGLSIMTSHLAVGASVVLTERSVIEPEFWRLFDANGCTSIAGVPHTYELLEKTGIDTSRHPSLRYATQAGGRLGPERVLKWAERSEREGWRFFVMYGQTEASPRMSYLPPEDARNYSDSIGRAIPGGAMMLVNEDGEELAGVGAEGELVYRGPNVMLGYATNDADLAKGREIEALHTGDIAERVTSDYYRIVGRKSRFIKPFGVRINLDEVEAWLASHGVSAATVGRDEALWVLAEDVNDPEALREEIVAWLNVTPDRVFVKSIETIPRTENGKIDNASVIAFVDKAILGKGVAKTGCMLNQLRRFLGFGGHGERKSVRDVFRRHFPTAAISDDSTFVALGGDSLSYISLAIDLEDALGRLPDGWQTATLSELERIKGGPTGLSRVDSATIMRAIAIFMIVSGHLHLIRYPGGGAMLLLAVAGFTSAAFQAPKIVTAGSIWPLAKLFLRVAAPTIGYLLLLSVVLYDFDYRILLLHSNFYSPTLGGGYAYWFIEVYVQILLILMAVLAIPAARKALERNPFRAAAAFTAFSILLFLAAHQLWDTNYLYRRLPQMLLWVFAAGAAAQYATTSQQRLVVTALYLGGAWLFGPNMLIQIVTGGILVLIWFPQGIVLPSWIARPVVPIAGASLFIYLTHFQFGSLADKILPGQPWFQVAVAMVGGVVVWRCYEFALNRFGRWAHLALRQV